MKTTYETLNGDQVTAKGGDLEALDIYERMTVTEGSWDVPASGVFRLVDGVPVELLGVDGGEPEDQTLGRDWKWVAPALQAAYDQGRHERLIERADEAIRAAAQRKEGQ